MSDENVHFEVDSRGIAWLTFARAKKLNALTPKMMRDIIAHLDSVDERGIRAVIITGEGSSFCAGMDIKAETEDGAVETFKNVLGAIERCPVATVARVHGYVMGGGLGIAAATDIVIASEDACFGMPELRIGMAPLLVSLYASCRIGWATARRWALTARHVPAEAALKDGFIDRISSADEDDQHLNDFIDQILKTAPEAAKVAKQFMQGQSSPSKDTIIKAMNTSARLALQEEATSGADAFHRREDPPWST